MRRNVNELAHTLPPAKQPVHSPTATTADGRLALVSMNEELLAEQEKPIVSSVIGWLRGGDGRSQQAGSLLYLVSRDGCVTLGLVGCGTGMDPSTAAETAVPLLGWLAAL